MSDPAQLVRELAALELGQLDSVLCDARTLRQSDPALLYKDLVDAARTVVSDWDQPDWQLSRLSKLIIDHSLPSINLCANPDCSRQVGQLGGFPRMPDGLPWPQLNEHHLPFIAQVHLSELPSLPGQLLPDHGILYFFCWCTNERTDTPCAVLWADCTLAELTERRLPEDRILPDWQGERVYDVETATHASCTLTLSKAAIERAATNSGILSSEELTDDFFGDFPGEYAGEIDGIVNPAPQTGRWSRQSLNWGQVLGYLEDDLLLHWDSVRGGYKDDGNVLCSNLLQVGSVNNMLWSDDGFLAFLIPSTDLADHSFGNVQAHVMSS